MNENTTRTEYALDYGAGLTCVSSDSTGAAKMAQFVPGSRVVARTVTESEWHPVDQGSEPEAPDLSLIPSSREEARPVEVNGSLGIHWLDGDRVLRLSAYGNPGLACWVEEITSVREVRVLADDEKVADSGMESRSRAWFAISAHPIFRGCLDGDGSLLDGMTSRLDEVMALIERAQAWDARYEDRATATVKPVNGVEILRDLAAVDRGEDHG